MEESSPFISCMDTADVRESPSPKEPKIRYRIPPLQVPETFGDIISQRETFEHLSILI